MGEGDEETVQGGRLQRLERLLELNALVASTLALDELQAVVVDTAVRLLDCEAASLLLLDEAGREVVFEVAQGERGEEVRRLRLAADEGLAGWVVQNDAPVRVADVAGDERHSPRVDQEVGFTTRAVLAVPLRSKAGVLGCLQALNPRRDGAFQEVDEQDLQHLANQVSIAVQNARLYGEVERKVKKIEQQQEALVQSEKLSAMGQLSAGVAHEIRSPLSAISGYAQLIRRRKPDAKILKPVHVIEEAASHINRIVNGLLDFARKDEPTFEPLSIDGVLARCFEMAEHSLVRYRKIELVRDLTPDLPPVVADARQLQQVFLQLMLNAAQAMGEGGTLTVKTFGEPPAGAPADSPEIGRVVLLFRDTGPGIGPDDRDKVFQPFFTAGKDGGTGLGLSICRSIVQKHRGAITFETTEGEGTTFRVHLPVDRGVKELLEQAKP